MTKTFSDIIRAKLKSLPDRPGVYQFMDEKKQIIYIGKASSLKKRVRQYFMKNPSMSERILKMISKINDIEIIVTDSEVEALILEANLVKKIKPRYNVSLKDDKSYPYIVVTNEPFPRIFITHRVIQDGSRYFGPYTDVRRIRSSLKMIREIFKIRSCNYYIDQKVVEKKKIKLCLDYHIGKCGGPCEGLVSSESYNSMVEEIVQVIKGKVKTLINTLKEKMDKASLEMRFEDAAEIRDKIRMLSVYTERQKIVDSEYTDRDIIAIVQKGDDACGVVFLVRDGMMIGSRHLFLGSVKGQEYSEIVQMFVEHYYLGTSDIPEEILLNFPLINPGPVISVLNNKSDRKVNIIVPKIGEKAKLINLCKRNAELLLSDLISQREQRLKSVPNSLIELMNQLRLSRIPNRIECFDVSTLQGTDTTASMVVFIDGKPKKSEYRKYKIGTVSAIDDYASIREVINRRYSHLAEENAIKPDLIVIDGGKGQISSAKMIMGMLNDIYEGINVEDITLIGLAKRLEEIYLPGGSEPLVIPRVSSALRLLQRIRDEAHRFALTYHRVLRKKRILQSELDLIKGVGRKRANELINVFGSVQGVKFATFEQLAAVVGETVAGNIKEYFIISEDI